MEALFRNTMKHTSDTLLELQKAYVLSTQWYYIVMLCITAVLVIIICTAGGFAPGLLIVPFFAIVLWRKPYTAARAAEKRLMAKYKQLPAMETSFYEDEMKILNTVSNATTVIPYTDVKLVKETENLVMIVRTSRAVLTLSKTGFTKGTLRDCASHIQKKAPKARILLRK